MSQQEVLIDAYASMKKALVSFAYARVNQVSLAEDLVQDAFVKALQHYAANPEKSLNIDNIQAWLMTVLRNTIFDHYRKLAAEGKHTASEADLDGLEIEEDTDMEMHGVLAECLMPFISSLPDKYQHVLIAKDIHGHSIRQISHATGVSESAIKSRLVRARGLLKQSLLDCCSFDISNGIVQDMTPKSSGTSHYLD